jgi:hypothetical protein
MKGMKGSLLVVGLVILLGCFGANGQSVSASDSLKIMQAVERVFRMFENPDHAQFEKESTDWIYCIHCREKPHPKHYYMMRRKEFFNEHLERINGFAYFQKAKNLSQVWLSAENNEVSDITAFISAWAKDECQIGHEGSCLGMNFKRDGNDFRFSGIETIP